MSKATIVHKYRYAVTGKNKDYEIMKCEDADCSHYLPIALAVGKLTRCFNCDQPFPLPNQSFIKRYTRKPVCPECKIGNKNQHHRKDDPKLTELLGAFGIKLGK